MTRIGKKPPRHRFILNPYPEERFALCPECDRPTEQRKVPLVIHIEPLNPVSLNKTCRYCPRCDLLIAHRDEVEAQLAALFGKRHPEVIGNDYLVLGTMDVEVWERGRQTPLTVRDTLDNLHDFQDVLRIQPADEEGKPLEQRTQKQPRPKPPGSGSRKPALLPVTPESVPERKLSRNDPCWCGSGKKYKHCHLRRDTK
jgi:SEC-C motif